LRVFTKYPKCNKQTLTSEGKIHFIYAWYETIMTTKMWVYAMQYQ